MPEFVRSSMVLRLQTKLGKLLSERKKLADEIWLIENVRNIRLTNAERAHISSYYSDAKYRIGRLDAQIKNCQIKLSRAGVCIVG